MQIDSTTTIAASAETIFALYADVAQWPTWDPDAKAASINGPFVSGATGTITPNGAPKSNITFSEVTRNRSFTADCKLPLCKMSFEHELKETADGTITTHRVIFTGLLAFFFGRVIGSGMKKSLPEALASLKKHAEQRAADGQTSGIRRVA